MTPSIQLVRQVDEGAMGSVWLADHVGLSTEVAVKFVSERLVDNPKALRRLEGEARAAARLKSPHVVKIFDYGVYEGTTPFFVMEYLEGESLRERLERDPILPLHEVALIVTHVARGLHKAHRLGIVHRDIKPDNLFMLDDDDDLFVKVLDFGVAKGLTKGVTEPGMLLGTPLYMSREGIAEGHIDHRMDLWALSVVAYETLTGTLPFDGETIDEVATAIWRGQFTPPSELNPELNHEVDHWFSLAFHRERQERPASAKQLAASFTRTLATIPGALLHHDSGSWRISQIDLMAHTSRPPFHSSPLMSSSPPASSAPPPSSTPPPSSSPPDSSSPPPHSGSPDSRHLDSQTRFRGTPTSIGPVVTPTSTRAPRREAQRAAPDESDARPRASGPPPVPGHEASVRFGDADETDVSTTSPSMIAPAPKRRLLMAAVGAAALTTIGLALFTGNPSPNEDANHAASAPVSSVPSADTTASSDAAPSAHAAPSASASASTSASATAGTPNNPRPMAAPRPRTPGPTWPTPGPESDPPAPPKKDLGF